MSDPCLCRRCSDKCDADRVAETKSAMEATLKTAMERSDNLMTIYGNRAYPAGRQGLGSTQDRQRTDESEHARAQPNLSVPVTEATAYGGYYGYGQEW